MRFAMIEQERKYRRDMVPAGRRGERTTIELGWRQEFKGGMSGQPILHGAAKSLQETPHLLVRDAAKRP